MNNNKIETIEKAIRAITDAAKAIKNINDALGGVIIRAADVSTSGSTLDATLKTLPNIQNQILYAARQIEQVIKEEEEPQKEGTKFAEQSVNENSPRKKKLGPEV